ncbi:MAG: hypothetical protein D6812_12775 [Deltaproteobacteria bacterium]|nr:MAG: hypothetical protein D6812_12775 [Deltaproteobacteria bacterium]
MKKGPVVLGKILLALLPVGMILLAGCSNGPKKEEKEEKRGSVTTGGTSADSDPITESAAPCEEEGCTCETDGWQYVELEKVEREETRLFFRVTVDAAPCCGPTISSTRWYRADFSGYVSGRLLPDLIEGDPQAPAIEVQEGVIVLDDLGFELHQTREEHVYSELIDLFEIYPRGGGTLLGQIPICHGAFDAEQCAEAIEKCRRTGVCYGSVAQ